MNLQSSLESKEEALDGLRQDLETSNATNQRLQDRLDEIRKQMDSKQSTLGMYIERAVVLLLCWFLPKCSNDNIGLFNENG